VLTRRSLYYDPFARKQLAEAGLWNSASLVDAILRKEFSLIMLYSTQHELYWTDEMLNAINSMYVIDRTLAGTDIYVPRR
jgi:hypothetical protein